MSLVGVLLPPVRTLFAVQNSRAGFNSLGAGRKVANKCLDELAKFKQDRSTNINKDVVLGEQAGQTRRRTPRSRPCRLNFFPVSYWVQLGPARTMLPSIARTPTTTPPLHQHWLA
jgi:hypothetical protein